MPLSDIEKAGITDLLYEDEENHFILLQLAKNITSNALDITNIAEALEYVHTHAEDILNLLNKRHITKEVLVKYLHKKKVVLTPNATKMTLMKKVVQYWVAESIKKGDNIKLEQITDGNNISTDFISKLDDTDSENHIILYDSESRRSLNKFPIHILAQQFSEWFFKNYNESLLKMNDFWPDVYLLLNILANDGCNETECFDVDTVMKTLQETRQRFNFHFLPNLTHEGVQGRMDAHGIVIALSCGTLHNITDCVGVFECAFGLLRDPFANNNWKCKCIRMHLRSKNSVNSTPTLAESDSLKEVLALPTPEGDLT